MFSACGGYMHSRISREAILLWTTVILVVGIALFQSKQYPLVISAALTLVLLVVAYWALPRYRSVPFFLLLAPSAIVTWVFSELLMVGNLQWQHSLAATALVIGLGSIVIAWRLPRYELVLIPAAIGLFVTSIHFTSTSGLWQQGAVAFVLAVLSIGALSAVRRLLA